MSLSSSRRPLIQSSIDLIGHYQASTGAYLAAPGYRTYEYSWLRDGAFIAAAMDAHGEPASARAFHTWVAGTVERYASKVLDLEANVELAVSRTPDPLVPLDGRYVLHTRFTVDGDEAVGAWGNFQLDGYGFWLTSVVRHLEKTGADPAPFINAIDLVCRYLSITWKLSCYDCWEEFPTRHHTTTLAAVAGGLQRSAGLLQNDSVNAVAGLITDRLRERAGASGVLRKFVHDRVPEIAKVETPAPGAVAGHERVGRVLGEGAIDGSILLVLGDFGLDGSEVDIRRRTLAAVEATLVVESGVHRYLEDEYYGGGLWIVLAGALACVQAEHRVERANDILDWIEHQADGDGHLSEQTDSHLRHPDQLPPWVDRWGPPATPLLWSHAMYLLGVASTQ
ncbi:MAG: hypothetical protein IIC71_04335 [Acidobacteria bacterium]|nr:hypothetical protein [Acidobacteriota bacterium]